MLQFGSKKQYKAIYELKMNVREAAMYLIAEDLGKNGEAKAAEIVESMRLRDEK